MIRYSKNQKPFVYAAFSGLDNDQAVPVLQKIEENGVSVWFSELFTKKEIRRIEAAYSCVIFISRHAVCDDRVRRCIEYAVKYNKKILCIYLEPTTLSPGLELLLNSLQSISKADFSDDAAFWEKLKSAEVFSGMQVTAAQKRFAKRRGLASVLVPITAAAVIFITIVYPLLIAPAVLAANGSLSKLGFGNLSLAELAEIEELNVVGTHSFDPWCYALYTDETKNEVYVNEIGGIVPTGDIRDISDLSLLKNAKVMTFAANQISDITPIYKIKTLEWLALNCNPIKSIEGIEALQNLKAISIAGTEINDVSPLYHIPSLEYISFENTYVNSIEGIEALPRLLGLNVLHSNLTDISPFNQIDFSYVNETEGFLFGAEESLIKDFSPLQRIPKFYNVNLTVRNADDILPYIRHKQVLALTLYNSDIKTIESLSSIQNLQILYLPDSNQLTSLEGIEEHAALRDIALPECMNITDFTPLLALPNLEHLSLSPNMKETAEKQLEGAAFEVTYEE